MKRRTGTRQVRSPSGTKPRPGIVSTVSVSITHESPPTARASFFAGLRDPVPAKLSEYAGYAAARLVAAGYPDDWRASYIYDDADPAGTLRRWLPEIEAESHLALVKRTRRAWVICGLPDALRIALHDESGLDPLTRCAGLLMLVHQLEDRMVNGPTAEAVHLAMQLQEQWDLIRVAPWEWFARVGQQQVANASRKAIPHNVKDDWVRLAREYRARHPGRRVSISELATAVVASGHTAGRSTIRAHLKKYLPEG